MALALRLSNLFRLSLGDKSKFGKKRPLQIETKSIQKYLLALLVLVSGIAYFLFAYSFNRSDVFKLFGLYTALFVTSFFLVSSNKDNIKLLIVLGVIFRLIFLFAIPNLSQDFYRFIWDGRMILDGLNPYLYTPSEILSLDQVVLPQAQVLYDGMGQLSAGNHTNYPPLNQLCFAIASGFFNNNILGSVVVMRIIIMLADLGTLWLGIKLLKQLNISAYRIFYYFLNPFIIIELTGNLHFEGLMLFFVVLSLYLLQRERWQLAAITLAFSVSIKLMPLIFLPLFYKKLGFKNWTLFCSIVIGVAAITFVPFFSMEFIHHYTDTVALWFQKFEFNASVYYVFRAIGYSFRGYNEIAIIGKIISFTVILFVLVSAILKRNAITIGLIHSMLFAMSFYFFTTTTMHPWYLATPLLLSIFTNYRFTLVWSFTIFLSYFAYVSNSNQENMWLLLAEYSVVYGVLFYEIYRKSKDIKKPALILN